MLKIGLTGGMGCGKSTIAHIFSAIGIPVYQADSRAKQISADPEVKAEIGRLFGAEAAEDKKKLADIVFSDPVQLARLNALIHPLVLEDCRKWFVRMETRRTPPPYAVAEAAILFESRMEGLFDYIIDTEAPVEDQIARCRERDRCSREDVLARLKNQMPAEERMRRSHFILRNGNRDRVLPAVLDIDKRLRGLAAGNENV